MDLREYVVLEVESEGVVLVIFWAFLRYFGFVGGVTRLSCFTEW